MKIAKVTINLCAVILLCAVNIITANVFQQDTLWGTKMINLGDNPNAKSVVTDNQGNVYVTGSYNIAGTSQGYVRKYNSTGLEQWTEYIEPPTINHMTTSSSVGVDDNGNVYVTGTHENVATSNHQTYLVSYSPAGIQRWDERLGNASNNYHAQDLAVNKSTNRIYITGSYRATSSTSHESFVVYYESDGTVLMGNGLFGPSNRSNSIALNDITGDIYISGSTTGSLDGNQYHGNRDAFVAKFDATLIRQWTRQIGTSQFEESYGVTVDQAGGVYITGRAEGDLDTMAPIFYPDAFVVKYDESGTEQWSKMYDHPGSYSSTDQGLAIAAEPDGNSVYTGIESIDTTPNGHFDGVLTAIEGLDGDMLEDLFPVGDSVWDIYLDGNYLYVVGTTGDPMLNDAAYITRYIVPEPLTLTLLAFGIPLLKRKK